MLDLNKSWLKELIDIGGRALEQEDRFIASCVVTKPNLYRDNDPAGLLRFKDERYYQVIIRRALMLDYRYRVTTEEHNWCDFVLSEATEGSPFAVGEMKRCRGGPSLIELSGMREDIAKLRDRMRNYGFRGFLIVATGCEAGHAKQQRENLRSGLDLAMAPEPFEYRFRTIGWLQPRSPEPQYDEREFALLGFEIPA